MSKAASAVADVTDIVTDIRSAHPRQFERHQAADLTVDPAVQRSVDQKWVKDRVDKFRSDTLGVLVCSRRPSNALHIVDGQHRHALCIEVGYEELLDCQVYTGLSLAEEAAMFRVLNDRRKVGVIDLFRVRVVEGDPVAVRLNELLNAHGWTVTPAKSRGSFSAVSALEKIYRGWGPQEATNLGVCESVISCITEAWDRNPHGARGEIVTGLGLLLIRHGQRVDMAKLVTEMAATSGGPLVLCGRAKALREMSGGRIGDAMATNFVNMLNKGRRTNRLPSWMGEE